MLTGYGDTESAVDCLRRGAVDYLLKPPKLTDLIRAIERALAKRRVELARKRYQKKLERKVRDRTAELRTALKDIANTYQNTLLALVAALDAREHETSDHSQRVVELHHGHRRSMGDQGPRAGGDRPRRAAARHRQDRRARRGAAQARQADARRVGGDAPAPGHRLQHDQSHPVPGHAGEDRPVAPGALRRPGLPAQPARKSEIHIGARIFAVADTLDAMTSDRPYRKGTTFANAIAEIQRCSGTQFDPEVVRAFLDIGEAGLVKIRDDMGAQKAPRRRRRKPSGTNFPRSRGDAAQRRPADGSERGDASDDR